jgi:adenylate kinase
MLGPPGSGKGTYAKMFAPMLAVPHISTGDALRKEIALVSALWCWVYYRAARMGLWSG